MGLQQNRFTTLIKYTLLLYLNIMATTSMAEQHKQYNDTWVSQSGDILQIALPTIAFGSTFFTDNKQDTMPLLGIFASTQLLTHALKRGVNRTRPDGTSHSFPSGHTSSAFMGASYIQSRYGVKWGIPAFVAASFVGYSRVHANKHYISDVIVGAALAIGVNYVLLPKRPLQAGVNLQQQSLQLSWQKQF